MAALKRLVSYHLAFTPTRAFLLNKPAPEADAIATVATRL